MLKKFLNKKFVKIAGLSLLLCFTLVSTISATFSWFGAEKSKEVEATVAVMAKDNAEDFSIDFKVYKWDETNKKGIESVNADKSYSFKLDSYDAFIANRNEHLSQLVEITLTSKVDKSIGGNVYLDVTALQPFLSSESNVKVGAYISNLVAFDSCFYSYTDSNDKVNTFFEMQDINRYKMEKDPETPATYEGDKKDQIYQEVKYYLDKGSYNKNTYINEADVKNLPDSKDPTFPQAMADINDEKLEELSLKVDIEKGNKIPDNWKKIVLYLRYDYSKTLAQFFASNQNATVYESTSGGSAISVSADISTIKVGIKK